MPTHEVAAEVDCGHLDAVDEILAQPHDLAAVLGERRHGLPQHAGGDRPVGQRGGNLWKVHRDHLHVVDRQASLEQGRIQPELGGGSDDIDRDPFAPQVVDGPNLAAFEGPPADDQGSADGWSFEMNRADNLEVQAPRRGVEEGRAQSPDHCFGPSTCQHGE